MKKLNSYQKIKQEKFGLVKDIHTLIYGSFIEKTKIEFKWKQQFELENLIWGKK